MVKRYTKESLEAYLIIEKKENRRHKQRLKHIQTEISILKKQLARKSGV